MLERDLVGLLIPGAFNMDNRNSYSRLGSLWLGGQVWRRGALIPGNESRAQE